jgi:hypothetical protein
MNTSPYFTGAAPNFGPPSGMASLINSQQNSQMDTSGFKQFYDVAQQYKQIQAQGKAADATVAAYPDLLKAANIHPEQYKTLGSQQKSAVVKGAIQGQVLQQQQKQQQDQAILNALRAKALNDELTANDAFGSAMGQARGWILASTLAQGNGPVQPRGMTMQDFANVASPEAWNAQAAAPFIHAMAKAGTATDDSAPEVVNIGGLPIIWKKGSKEFQPDPRVAIDSRLDAQKQLLSVKQQFRDQLVANGFKPAVNSATGEVIDDVYSDPTGKTIDLRSQIDKLTGASTVKTPATSSNFDSESAARAAGKKAGDVVTLKGIGKVRLK